MLDAALEALGPERLLWGCDLTIETGLAKLRAFEAIGLEREKIALIRWKNAARIFPPDTFPGLMEGRSRRMPRTQKAATRPLSRAPGAVRTTDS
jgi:hypothetical protein